jgi:hypothetical protein
MPTTVTAKIQCSLKEKYGEQTTVSFGPDYQDGRNKEWATATPALSLTMTLNGSVADQFEPGMKYTLTFERADDGADGAGSADDSADNNAT